MTHVLAFDIGRTSCRAALYVGEVRRARTQVASPGGLSDADGTATFVDALRTAAAELDAPTPDAVGAGVAGLEAAPHRAQELVDALVTAYGTRRVAVASDMTTSHAGALGGRAGVVVAAGTGAVALAVGPDGATARCDGWGHLLGDEGSGHAIGRAGLAAALRHHDGRGGSGALHRRAVARFGQLDGLPGLVHDDPHPVRLVASFAPDVLAAAQDGDPTAREIWSEAGRQLAATAAAAVGRLRWPDGDVSVAATGGLFDAGDLLRDPFAGELAARAPATRLVAPVGDALDGARLIATVGTLPHAPLTTRPTSAPQEQP